MKRKVVAAGMAAMMAFSVMAGTGATVVKADDEDTIRRGVSKYVQLHSDRFTQVYEAEKEEKNHFAREAQEYIAEHYAEDILQSEVAEKLGISGDYLSIAQNSQYSRSL